MGKMETEQYRGAFVIQLVDCSTLDLAQVIIFWVHGFEPSVRLHTGLGVCLGFLSPGLSLPLLLLVHTLSPKINI